MKKLHVLIPSLVATASMPLIGLVGCGNPDTPTPPEPEPVASDFNTDPWSTVCYFANQGIEKLYEVYATDCEENPYFPGTLVGLFRDVTINGNICKVMVVGENQDFQTYNEQNGELSNPVALTFQFERTISGSDKNAILKHWDETNSDNYWNSTIYHFLNDHNNNSVYQMINEANKDLVHGMKPIFRTVSTKEEGNWVSTTKQTNLFVPSIANIFPASGIDNSTLITEKANKDLYHAEGIQYKYYESEMRDQVVDTSTTHSCLTFKDMNNSNNIIWFSSPRLETSNVAYFAYGNGTIGIDQAVDWNHAIAPCFCI